MPPKSSFKHSEFIKHIHGATSGNKYTRKRAYFCLRLHVCNKDFMDMNRTEPSKSHGI